MPFNVMIQLCKITRASKLFQRNFYLPLLKPLSPKDAARKHLITGKNVLTRFEHYIPVLEEYKERMARRRGMMKGQGKKRQRKKSSMKYVMPLLDQEMDGHSRLMSQLSRKPRGRGQCYTYFVPDKMCTLVLTFQMERAIRDKDIIDVIMAQRTEKVVFVMKDYSKVSMPLVSYDGNAPFYSGEGWTRKDVEEKHHHGRETMAVARLFEAKEQGLDEWELEMMRMASKRKKKGRGEGTQDWKAMMAAQATAIDWEQFEEDAKQMVEEQHEPIDDEPIPMEIDSMEKTTNVCEKLQAAGKEVMDMLPTMPEIPEIIATMKDEGELTEIANVSGIKLTVKSTKKDRFVPGQVVKSDDGDLFVPGQTVVNDNGDNEYTPGFTVMLEGEPTLIPGLVMGNDPNKAVFLPGESTITASGELQFAETEDDIRLNNQQPEVEEVELEELEEEEEKPAPPPKRKPQQFSYERPQRQFSESMGPKRRERGPKLPPVPPPEPAPLPPPMHIEPVLHDLSMPLLEKDLLEQQKDRVENFKEKTGKAEAQIDNKRREMKLKIKQMRESLPPKPKYLPMDPVKKSEKLKDMEQSIRKGKFFDPDYKRFLNKDRPSDNFWKLEPPEYGNIFDTVGIWRHRLWRSVV